MISKALKILVIISSLYVISTLQLPPKAMAQTPFEVVKVFVDDVEAKSASGSLSYHIFRFLETSFCMLMFSQLIKSIPFTSQHITGRWIKH
jgi:hypothetical protein